MSWLYALETLRHAAPWLASIFSIITYLGGEAVFFAVGLFLMIGFQQFFDFFFRKNLPDFKPCCSISEQTEGK